MRHSSPSFLHKRSRKFLESQKGSLFTRDFITIDKYGGTNIKIQFT